MKVHDTQNKNLHIKTVYTHFSPHPTQNTENKVYCDIDRTSYFVLGRVSVNITMKTKLP